MPHPQRDTQRRLSTTNANRRQMIGGEDGQPAAHLPALAWTRSELTRLTQSPGLVLVNSDEQAGSVPGHLDETRLVATVRLRESSPDVSPVEP